MADTTGPARRAVLALAAVALGAAAAAAQVPDAAAAPPAAPVYQPTPTPTPVDVLAPGAWPFDPQPAPAAAPRKPLPGSAADQFARDYAAREGFHCCWGDSRYTFLPPTLLWEPPLAAKREPRLAVEPITLDNYTNTWTLDTSIGAVAGLVRGQPGWSPALEWQIDLMAVAHTRLTPNDLIAADYRFGFPVSARYGPWHAKVGYEHTSAHVGDEGVLFGGLPINPFTKDEFVAGVGRWFEDYVRVYGQVSYAFFIQLPGDERGKWRFDVGFEAYDRRPTGLRGTPYWAVHADFREDQNYAGNLAVQTGWLWRNPESRLADWRMFLEYYTGRSPYGAFFDVTRRENFFGAGLAVDY